MKHRFSPRVQCHLRRDSPRPPPRPERAAALADTPSETAAAKRARALASRHVQGCSLCRGGRLGRQRRSPGVGHPGVFRVCCTCACVAFPMVSHAKLDRVLFAQVWRSVAYRRPTRVCVAFLGIWNDLAPASTLPRTECPSLQCDDTRGCVASSMVSHGNLYRILLAQDGTTGARVASLSLKNIDTGRRFA